MDRKRTVVVEVCSKCFSWLYTLRDGTKVCLKGCDVGVVIVRKKVAE